VGRAREKTTTNEAVKKTSGAPYGEVWSEAATARGVGPRAPEVELR